MQPILRRQPGHGLRRRRAELRPSLSDPHNPPPAWLTQLAAELEQEISRKAEAFAHRAADPPPTVRPWSAPQPTAG